VSFRGRLRLFFVLLVIVPMIALALVLFTLTSRSETGKADAGISAGTRTAFGVYEESAANAEPALREVASDRRLRAALASGAGVDARLDELVAGGTGAMDIVVIELYSPNEQLIARAGSPGGVAPRAAPISSGGETLGILAVSVTGAHSLAARVQTLTGLDAAVYRGDRLLAATTDGLRDRSLLGEVGDPHDVELTNGEEYRARVESIAEPAGAPVEIAVLQNTASISDAIAEDRLVIGGLLIAFLLLAMLAAAGVSRALTSQIGTFLDAARRLARGDFAHPVPVSGNDEFAQLGNEFNSMSAQLEAKIEEIERKREELEATIRRVGDALATGLDRDGVVALAVRQAVDACGAEAGRALPLERGAFHEKRSGREDPALDEAIVAAERLAFEPRPELATELLDPERPARPRRAVAAEASNAHALAVTMRALVSSAEPEYLGVLSIARSGRAFTREEEELLEYLAGQAIVSIENASLHETVGRQAVTDELTGLANARAFRSILDREIERSRRFQSPLSLVMLDLDDFKQVNDRYGHQQGDEVLASVAAVLRDFSRDIDAPARYGGEELAVVLPQTDSDGAELLAERMREAVERLRVPSVSGRDPLRVTASFGVASVPESAADREELVAAADAALYRAKRGGKNRVERAERVAAPG
jgi:diguanylate cyclase (GGDEF)-like protein